MLKLLRRDPTAYITLIQGLLALSLAFHLFGLTDTLVPLIMAVINGLAGVVTAILTKRAGFAFAMGLITALINLFAGYGLSLSVEQTNGVLLVSTILLGIFGWTVNSPADAPGLNEEPMPSEPVVVNTFSSVSLAEADAIAAEVARNAGRGGPAA
jgi:hypothetical protein